MVRTDDTWFQWISDIGGFSVLFSLGVSIAGSVDSATVFVTAAMLADGKVHKIYSASRSASPSTGSMPEVKRRNITAPPNLASR